MHGIPLEKMAREDRATFYQGIVQETNVADRRHVSARGHMSALQRFFTNLGYLRLQQRHRKNKLTQSNARFSVWFAFIDTNASFETGERMLPTTGNAMQHNRSAKRHWSFPAAFRHSLSHRPRFDLRTERSLTAP
jgi:hypothetical protein